MTTALRRFIIILLGTLAGAIAWPLLELILHFQESFPGYLFFSLAQGAVLGLVMGIFFATGEGLTSKQKGKILRGAVIGGIVGIAGGIAGFMAGQGVLFLLVRRISASYAVRMKVLVPVARIVGWTILGTAVGMSEGIRARSLKKCLVGLLGGFVGGAIGGGAFEYLPALLPDILFSRLIGLLLLGGLIGLFYSLLERRVSLGVVKILNGPDRGKEYSLVQKRTGFGKSAKNPIVLAGYSSIDDKHGRFLVRGRDVFIQQESETGNISVNERPVKKEQPLKYEDVIHVGSAKLLYKTE